MGEDGTGVMRYQPTESRREDFLAEYVSNGYDQKAAYLKVYPESSPTTVSANSARYLQHPRTQRILQQVRQKIMAKMEINEKTILAELARIAFLDLGECYDEDGYLLPLSEMSEDARRALAAIESVQLPNRDDGDLPRVLKKIKAESKIKALELLGKHLAMFTDKIEHSGSSDLAAQIMAARQRTTEVHITNPQSVVVFDAPNGDEGVFS